MQTGPNGSDNIGPTHAESHVQSSCTCSSGISQLTVSITAKSACCVSLTAIQLPQDELGTQPLICKARVPEKHIQSWHVVIHMSGDGHQPFAKCTRTASSVIHNHTDGDNVKLTRTHSTRGLAKVLIAGS